jgi:hypothetical protein
MMVQEKSYAQYLCRLSNVASLSEHEQRRQACIGSGGIASPFIGWRKYPKRGASTEQ